MHAKCIFFSCRNMHMSGFGIHYSLISSFSMSVLHRYVSASVRMTIQLNELYVNFDSLDFSFRQNMANIYLELSYLGSLARKSYTTIQSNTTFLYATQSASSIFNGRNFVHKNC